MALPAGSIIGILGGGQLGRMLAIAAAEMGYKTHIFCPEPNCPAEQVANVTTTADYDNRLALTAFAASVDVVTFEFENIPSDILAMFSAQLSVHPSASVLETCRNRITEKQFINECGIKTAPYKAVTSLEELEAAIETIGTPAILKTTELGYDGKGQARIMRSEECKLAWMQLQSSEAIVEAFVDFAYEVSVIVARDESGNCVSYPPVENRHDNGILDVTIAPAQMDATLAQVAKNYAETLANALQLVGILAVEMFIGKDGSITINELAPRPHNSGHWSIEAAITSQFRQHIRAICGLPLGSAAIICPAEMQNLIGSDAETLDAHRANPNAHIHLYGKREARTGRKMGHVTTLKPRSVPNSTSHVASVGVQSE